MFSHIWQAVSFQISLFPSFFLEFFPFSFRHYQRQQQQQRCIPNLLHLLPLPLSVQQQPQQQLMKDSPLLRSSWRLNAASWPPSRPACAAKAKRCAPNAAN
jgi:hypothetical protein